MPDKIQKVETIKDSIVTPKLPEASLEHPVQLTIEQAIKKLLVDCIIEMETHDYSGKEVQTNGKKYYEDGKYADGSKIVIVAMWGQSIYKRCRIYYERFFRILHQNDEMIEGLHFIMFYTLRDKFQNDYLNNGGIRMFNKEIANRINWS